MPQTSPARPEIFVGDSEMAALMRAKDWSATPLGPPEAWPESLKAALRILLTSRFEMWLGWGPEIAFFYNDAYRPTLGIKHPAALGTPTRQLWSEIWDDVEDRIRTVYDRGEATWDRGLLLLLERSGYPEETYHTFSYSPLLDDDGRVGGLFCAVSEETNRVISERRLDSLRILAENLATVEGHEAVLAAAAAGLSENRRDLLFTLTYLSDGPDAAGLAEATGIASGHPGAPDRVVAGEAGIWPLVPPASETVIALDPGIDWPTGAWERPPAQAVVLPLIGQGGEAPIGMMVVGLNPYRPFDADYRGFLKLIAGQISSSLASAAAYEAEIRRMATLAEAVQIRQQAAEALRLANAGLVSEVKLRTEERDRLQKLFQRAPGFMCVLRGPDHVFEFMNEAYRQLVGHRDLIGLTLTEGLPEIAGQGFIEILDQVYRTGQPFVGHDMPVDLQREPGAALEKRFVNLVYQPVEEIDGSVSRIFAEGHDVTERVRAEEALRRLNETLEHEIQERTQERDRAWRLSQDLLVVIDIDGTIAALNTTWTTLLGWTGRTLIGVPFTHFAHPDDLAATTRALADLIETPLTDPFEFRFRHADGSYRWFAWTGAFEDGRIYASGRDTTAEREQAAALALAEDSLRQSQKMEAVGQLTGGIAHDFNNLLTGIVGSLDLMQARLAQGRTDSLERYAQAAIGSANRAAALTHRLLAFARRQPLDPRPVDVNDLVGSLEDLLRRTIGESIDLHLVRKTGLWPILCDPHQLESAILNLAINGRDAMPGGGQLSIETDNTYLDAVYARTNPGVETGSYVRIGVVDTGTGMTPDVIAKAFDPFFTTKPLGQGTGLGLSMIYGFVHQSGGHARITSRVGAGTSVALYLPRYRGEVVANAATPAEADPHHAVDGECVLVVEDDPVVRDLIVEVLGDLGYRALQAPDGLAGLEILQSPDPIDLVVTDVGLPGLNGRQMIDQARALRPDLKVLFITGYAENAIFGQGHLDPGLQMITKPFPPDVLASRIRAMIGG